MSIDQARELLQARLDELEKETKEVRDALRALDGKPLRHRSSSEPAARTRTGRRAGSKRQRGKSTRLDQVVAYLREHPEARTADVATGIGVSASAASNLLRQGREAGIVRKKGRLHSLKS